MDQHFTESEAVFLYKPEQDYASKITALKYTVDLTARARIPTCRLTGRLTEDVSLEWLDVWDQDDRTPPPARSVLPCRFIASGRFGQSGIINHRRRRCRLRSGSVASR